jgi:hypothetical protein
MESIQEGGEEIGSGVQSREMRVVWQEVKQFNESVRWEENHGAGSPVRTEDRIRKSSQEGGEN